MKVGDQRHTAQRMALFNHKGGVGKTTLTINIAHALIAMGKRVLLVDSDPQCNLTSYLVEDSVVNNLLDTSDEASGRTLWSAVKPLVEALGDVNFVSPLAVGEGLFLLPGDIRLAEFEQELGTMWAECFQRKLKGFRGITALSTVVNHACQEQGIDYVFYDAGPNIGPLNRIILLDSDFFIIPAACDLFSVRALKTLGHTMSTWIRDWQTIVDLAPDVYLLPGRPALMGYITQRFKVYAGTYTAEFSHMLPQIERAVQADVAALLRRIDPDLVPFGPSALRIGEVQEFGSLAVAAQKQGTAIADVHSGTADQRAVAWEAFMKIATTIVERT